MHNELLKHKAFFQERLRQGLAIEAALEQLSQEAPLIFVDLCVGEFAVGGDEFVGQALNYIDVLEAHFPNRSLFKRLHLLSTDLHIDIFKLACQRHPEAEWLIELSKQISTTELGLGQKLIPPVDVGPLHFSLMPSESISKWTQLYIKEEMMGGVYSLARSGSIVPMKSLLQHGDYSKAVIAAHLALDVNPKCGAIEAACAQMGLNIEDWVLSVIQLMNNPRSVEVLLPIIKWYPKVILYVESMSTAE